MRTQLYWTSVVAMLAAGCAPSVGSVDRTQPDAIHKSQFSGLWYTKGTVVETQPGAEGAIDGYSSDMDKVRWEISRDMLLAYRSYEFIPYAEGLTDEGRDFFGSPVAAYPILSHFDIQRQYNATTGVETNVIVENTVDRPWYEREYIRVDWTRNMVGGLTWFRTGWQNFEGGFRTLSVAVDWDRNFEETNPHRPTFTSSYMDVTQTYQLEPDPFYCYYTLLYNGVARCGAQNARIRLSFLKVDPTEDYQSMYYPDVVELRDDEGKAIVVDGNGRPCGADADGDPRAVRDPTDCRFSTFPVFQAFGNFRVNRVAFDKERYLTNTGRIFLVGRHNLWQNSFDDVTGQPIAYRDRGLKPIVYHTNVDTAPDMVAASQRLAQSWAAPVNETVAYLQGFRTADFKPDVDAWKRDYAAKNGGKNIEMFVVENNRCNADNIVRYARENGLEDVVNRVAGSASQVARGNVEKVCAAVQWAELQAGKTLDAKKAAEGKAQLAFTWQREGDLRYSFTNYVEVEQPGPWGVAQFSTDPETGEYVQVAANYFGNAGDLFAQRETDRVQWLNGELDDMTLLKGDLNRNTVISRRGNTNRSIRLEAKGALMAHDQEVANSMQDSGMTNAGSSIDSADARMKRMFGGTDLEREFLVTDEVLRGFAGPALYQPSGAVPSLFSSGPAATVIPGQVSDAALSMASPTNWGTDVDSNELLRDVKKLGGNAIEYAAFFDPNTTGLARFLKGKPRDEINQWLRVELFVAVQLHEVGHTMGLRHNFGASMDPLNYRPEFWSQGYWNNPPKPSDDVSVANRGNEFKYASIMDYGFGVAQEGLHGIGPYDQAAVRFMYGELLDVWNPDKVVIPDPRKYASFARRCGHTSAFLGFGILSNYLDYPSLPSILGSTPGDDQISPLFEEMVNRLEANAAGSRDVSNCLLFAADVNRVLDRVITLPPKPENVVEARMVVPMEALLRQEKATILNRPEYDRPETADVNEADNGEDDDGDGIADDQGGVQDFFTDRGREGVNWDNYLHRVEYSFCPDDFAGYSPGCQVWDVGGNFLEAVDAHINAYDQNYLFDSFRRDRFSSTGWGNPRAYLARLEGRRFFHLVNVFRYYLYTRRSTFANTPLIKNWAEAAYRGLNTLERVLQTPEPGPHCLDRGRNVYVPESRVPGGCANDPDRFEVGIGATQGKFHDSEWTNEYYYKTNRVGAFWDKVAAIRMITSSSGSFIRDFSDFFDRRAFQLGYMRAYEDTMIQRWNALVRGVHDGYRSAVLVDDEGKKYVRYMPLFDESNEDGSSVHQSLDGEPTIEPSWSWTLQFYGLQFAMANWASVNDAAPEFYRFTKIAIRGTPEDVDYPASTTMVEFRDPETSYLYRAPRIPARPPRSLVQNVRPYKQTNSWGIGADTLDRANTLLTTDYQPKKATCDSATGAAKVTACQEFEGARRRLNELVGFIDIMRRFNRRAEYP